METKKATPSKVTKKKKTPTKSTAASGLSSAKSTPSKKSSTAARGANDDTDKHFLWLCFANNGGKTTPDYNVIGAKLGIGYKAATGRFYKLRNQFENMEKSSTVTEKEGKDDDKSINDLETAIKTDSDHEEMDDQEEEASEDA